MPDITMCRDKECPQKEQCYRYEAVPNEHWQGYFVFSPREQEGCNFYWPLWKQGYDS